MMNVSQQATQAPLPREATPAARVTRVAFVEDAPASALRVFTQPRRAAAVEEDVSLESAAAASDQPELVEQLLVVCLPEGSSSQGRERARALVERPGRIDTSRAITLEHGADALEWRPGLAIVQCREGNRSDLVSALVDFAFYEGQLRALEEAVDATEAEAQSDVALAHRIRYRDRNHWARLTGCSERCSRMRLTFARLEPQLLAASRTLAPAARSWMSRLLQKAEMESRLESVSDRLEALEELYEGATQRISEHRWYVSGHALEIGIIALLLVECSLMSADIYLHNRDRQAARGHVSVVEVSEEP